MSDQDITNVPEHNPPPFDERKGADRRVENLGAPNNVERRRLIERRKMRAKEGRERYLDMVQKERSMFMEQGVVRSTEQLMDMAGAAAPSDMEEEGIRDRATGDQLRSLLPVQTWLPLSIHLIGLRDGVLYIAPLNEPNDRQLDALVSSARRTKLKVDRVEIELGIVPS